MSKNGVQALGDTIPGSDTRKLGFFQGLRRKPTVNISISLKEARKLPAMSEFPHQQPVARQPDAQNTTTMRSYNSNVPEQIDTLDGATDLARNMKSLDGLLAELDAGEEDEKQMKEEVVAIGASRKLPDHYLETNPTTGLTEHEATIRRKLYGLNQMREEYRNHFIEFLLFFVGPIQFVMEVNQPSTYCYSPIRNTNVS